MTDEEYLLKNSMEFDLYDKKKKRIVNKEVNSEIYYSTLTRETLEEMIEFIDDWSLVPTELIDNELCQKFNHIGHLRQRVKFEETYSKLKEVVDKTKFPNRIFFFLEEECYMDLDTQTGVLCYSVERFWGKRPEEIGYSSFSMEDSKDTRVFQRAMSTFGSIKFGIHITPNLIHSKSMYQGIEQYFKSKINGNHKS